MIGGAPYLSVLPADFRDTDLILTWNPRLDLGGIYRLDTVTLGLTAALAWLGVRTTPYAAVDKNLDGVFESVVTEEVYQTSTAGWGAGNTGYTWKDQADEYYLALSPSLVWKASEKLSLVATGGFACSTESRWFRTIGFSAPTSTSRSSTSAWPRHPWSPASPSTPPRRSG